MTCIPNPARLADEARFSLAHMRCKPAHETLLRAFNVVCKLFGDAQTGFFQGKPLCGKLYLLASTNLKVTAVLCGCVTPLLSFTLVAAGLCNCAKDCSVVFKLRFLQHITLQTVETLCKFAKILIDADASAYVLFYENFGKFTKRVYSLECDVMCS